MARGRLARPWGEQTKRAENDPFANQIYDANAAADHKVNEAVATIARAKGKTMAQIALAWVLQKQPVAAPIVGVSKLEQLTDALGAIDVKLSADDVAALEADYTPRANAGFQ